MKRRETSRDSRLGNRSVSRETSNPRAVDRDALARSSMNSARKEVDSPTDENLEAKVHIVEKAPNHETSLRHFFYLEYKKKFGDGIQNPIVYSRFGKSHYHSDERFEKDNFNQLVRTCNLKKLLKAHEAPTMVCDRMGNPIK